MGMTLAAEIVERAVSAPYHPEMRHDSGRSFASVSRAVRLTVVLEAKVHKEIIAFRNGAPALASILKTASKTTPDRVRAKIESAVSEAISREVGDVDEARDALDRVRERLIEGEDYDAFLSGSWRDCVAAICADLGLDPDWSDWSDEVGFTPSVSRPRGERQSCWTHAPGDAEIRRRGKADRITPGAPPTAIPTVQLTAPLGQGPP